MYHTFYMRFSQRAAGGGVQNLSPVSGGGWGRKDEHTARYGVWRSLPYSNASKKRAQSWTKIIQLKASGVWKIYGYLQQNAGLVPDLADISDARTNCYILPPHIELKFCTPPLATRSDSTTVNLPRDDFQYCVSRHTPLVKTHTDILHISRLFMIWSFTEEQYKY